MQNSLPTPQALRAVFRDVRQETSPWACISWLGLRELFMWSDMEGYQFSHNMRGNKMCTYDTVRRAQLDSSLPTTSAARTTQLNLFPGSQNTHRGWVLVLSQ